MFKAVLNKGTLASQPTISRFHNRMDEDSLNQFLSINQILRKKVYSIQMPEAIILDLDSTLLNAYGKQEGRAFNFHYQSNGYHLLVCYDGITKNNKVDYAVAYGEFMYQAGPWPYERRVVCKAEKLKTK